jgi:hypothetical protein
MSAKGSNASSNNASIFYSGLYGDCNTNVLVKLAQDEDVSEISRGKELDKHSICPDLNSTVTPSCRDSHFSEKGGARSLSM